MKSVVTECPADPPTPGKWLIVKLIGKRKPTKTLGTSCLTIPPNSILGSVMRKDGLVLG